MAKQVTNASSDGLVFGQTITDKIGFFGLTTAIVQPTSANQAAITAVVTTTTPTVTAFGFTSAQAAALIEQSNALKVLVNQMRTDLVALGLLKGS